MQVLPGGLCEERDASVFLLNGQLSMGAPVAAGVAPDRLLVPFDGRHSASGTANGVISPIQARGWWPNSTAFTAGPCAEQLRSTRLQQRNIDGPKSVSDMTSVSPSLAPVPDPPPLPQPPLSPPLSPSLVMSSPTSHVASGGYVPPALAAAAAAMAKRAASGTIAPNSPAAALAGANFVVSSPATSKVWPFHLPTPVQPVFPAVNASTLTPTSLPSITSMAVTTINPAVIQAAVVPLAPTPSPAGIVVDVAAEASVHQELTAAALPAAAVPTNSPIVRQVPAPIVVPPVMLGSPRSPGVIPAARNGPVIAPLTSPVPLPVPVTVAAPLLSPPKAPISSPVTTPVPVAPPPVSLPASSSASAPTVTAVDAAPALSPVATPARATTGTTAITTTPVLSMSEASTHGLGFVAALPMPFMPPVVTAAPLALSEATVHGQSLLQAPPMPTALPVPVITQVEASEACSMAQAGIDTVQAEVEAAAAGLGALGLWDSMAAEGVECSAVPHATGGAGAAQGATQDGAAAAALDLVLPEGEAAMVAVGGAVVGGARGAEGWLQAEDEVSEHVQAVQAGLGEPAGYDAGLVAAAPLDVCHGDAAAGAVITQASSGLTGGMQVLSGGMQMLPGWGNGVDAGPAAGLAVAGDPWPGGGADMGAGVSGSEEDELYASLWGADGGVAAAVPVGVTSRGEVNGGGNYMGATIIPSPPQPAPGPTLPISSEGSAAAAAAAAAAISAAAGAGATGAGPGAGAGAGGGMRAEGVREAALQLLTVLGPSCDLDVATCMAVVQAKDGDLDAAMEALLEISGMAGVNVGVNAGVGLGMGVGSSGGRGAGGLAAGASLGVGSGAGSGPGAQQEGECYMFDPAALMGVAHLPTHQQQQQHGGVHGALCFDPAEYGVGMTAPAVAAGDSSFAAASADPQPTFDPAAAAYSVTEVAAGAAAAVEAAVAPLDAAADLGAGMPEALGVTAAPAGTEQGVTSGPGFTIPEGVEQNVDFDSEYTLLGVAQGVAASPPPTATPDVGVDQGVLWSPAMDRRDLESDKLDELRIYFPACDSSELQSALDACGGDVFSTVDLLFKYQEEEASLQVARDHADAELAAQLQAEDEQRQLLQSQGQGQGQGKGQVQGQELMDAQLARLLAGEDKKRGLREDVAPPWATMGQSDAEFAAMLQAEEDRARQPSQGQGQEQGQGLSDEALAAMLQQEEEKKAEQRQLGLEQGQGISDEALAAMLQAEEDKARQQGLGWGAGAGAAARPASGLGFDPMDAEGALGEDSELSSVRAGTAGQAAGSSRHFGSSSSSQGSAGGLTSRRFEAPAPPPPRASGSGAAGSAAATNASAGLGGAQRGAWGERQHQTPRTAGSGALSARVGAGAGGGGYGAGPVQEGPEKLAKRVRILQGLFGGAAGVTQDVLTATLEACGGDVDEARDRLREMGLQERALAPGSVAALEPPGTPPSMPSTSSSQPSAPSSALAVSNPTSWPSGAGMTASYTGGHSGGAAGAGAGVPYTGVGHSAGAAGATVPFASSSAAVVPRGPLSHEETQNLYEKHRAWANHLQQRREQLMQASQLAWDKGNRALSKQLSEEGIALKEAISREHRQAADALYAARNSVITNTWTMDLHALHPQEAVEKVAQKVAVFRAEAAGLVRLKVITGRGKHSRGDPILLPVVKSWLEEQGLRYTEQVGCLNVDVLPNSMLAALPAPAPAPGAGGGI